MSVFPEDTIVAVSTPRGRAATGIIRLSGPKAFEIVSAMLEQPPERRTYTRSTGRLRLPRTAPFPVAVYIMLAPRSYTREDVVEIHAPGSPALLAEILAEARRRGARLAEAGEFTRRAFLNGRVDLAQAEAVMAVVRAASDGERKLALSALAGDFSREVGAVRDRLLDLAADMEAGLDFTEEDVTFADAARQREVIGSAIRDLNEILRRSASRRVFSEDVVAVLYGTANAGKSSIFNMLVGSPEALVAAAPGTTRDFLEAEVDLEGVRFLLVDTAGVRTPTEVIEAVAVERSVDRAAQAQLVLFVADASTPLDDETARLYRTARDGPHIVVLNKIDLSRAVTAEDWRGRFGDGPLVELSALTGKGARELELAMARAVIGGEIDLSASRFLIEERHRGGLEESLGALDRALEAVEDDRGDEFVAFELREAAEAVGRITGRTYAEDLLDAVFSRFCIGK